MSDGALATDNGPRRTDLYSLRLLGDPCLRVEARPVESLAGIPRALIQALERINARVWTRSAGLSSQQVGGIERVAIALFEPGKSSVCINLKIVERSLDTVLCPGEGCISIPHFTTSTRRHPWVIVEYRNERWEVVRRRLEGFHAQVAQHESDHLDGRMISDGLGRNQRRAAERCVADFMRRAHARAR